MHTISPNVTSRQKQVIMGAILGGSSLVRPSNSRNCYMTMRHKDAEWLTYKASELAVLASEASLWYDGTNRWRSLSYPIFNEYYNLFYSKNGKRQLASEEVLSPLQDIAFAIWFVDAGKYDGKNAMLNIRMWGNSNKNIVDYFRIVGFDVNLINYKVVFTKKSSKKLFKLIAPQLPEFLTRRFS